MTEGIQTPEEKLSVISSLVSNLEEKLRAGASRKDMKLELISEIADLSLVDIAVFKETAKVEQLACLHILENLVEDQLTVAAVVKTGNNSEEDSTTEEEVEEVEEDEAEEENENQIAQAAEKLAETFSYKADIVKFSIRTWDKDTGRKEFRMNFMSGSKRANDGWSGFKHSIKTQIQKLSIDGAVLGLAKLMEKYKLLNVAIKSLGTAMLPFFVLAAMLFTFLRLLRNPLRPITKMFRELFEGSALESFLQPDEAT